MVCEVGLAKSDQKVGVHSHEFAELLILCPAGGKAQAGKDAPPAVPDLVKPKLPALAKAMPSPLALSIPS